MQRLLSRSTVQRLTSCSSITRVRPFTSEVKSESDAPITERISKIEESVKQHLERQEEITRQRRITAEYERKIFNAGGLGFMLGTFSMIAMDSIIR
jgi:hypothetical protein